MNKGTSQNLVVLFIVSTVGLGVPIFLTWQRYTTIGYYTNFHASHSGDKLLMIVFFSLLSIFMIVLGIVVFRSCFQK